MYQFHFYFLQIAYSDMLYLKLQSEMDRRHILTLYISHMLLTHPPSLCIDLDPTDINAQCSNSRVMECQKPLWFHIKTFFPHINTVNKSFWCDLLWCLKY